MTDRERWDDRRYQRMRSVAYRDGMIAVSFEDGSRTTLDASRALPRPVERPDWPALEFDKYEVRVPTPSGPVEIPWSTIRALTDKGYSAHLAATAAEQARLIGRRIKELRRGRGLTGKELAERAGITPQSLSRIEHGHHDIVFTTLQRVLAAMGHSLADLAASESESAIAGS